MISIAPSRIAIKGIFSKIGDIGLDSLPSCFSILEGALKHIC